MTAATEAGSGSEPSTSGGQRRTIELDGDRTLSYLEYGDPQGTPLVFLHGTPGSGLLGALFRDGARRTETRVLAIDRPGYGRSSSPSIPTVVQRRSRTTSPKSLATFATACPARNSRCSTTPTTSGPSCGVGHRFSNGIGRRRGISVPARNILENLGHLSRNDNRDSSRYLQFVGSNPRKTTI
jgi:hypothetical protein